MSITVKEFEEIVKEITQYPSLSRDQIIIAANKTLQTIADSYEDWKFLKQNNSSLSTTLNSSEVDTSAITDIAFINFIISEHTYRKMRLIH